MVDFSSFNKTSITHVFTRPSPHIAFVVVLAIDSNVAVAVSSFAAWRVTLRYTKQKTMKGDAIYGINQCKRLGLT